MKRDYLQITKVDELWKLEKSKFRKFIIGSSISMIILFILNIIQFGLNLPINLNKINIENDRIAFFSSLLFQVLLMGFNIYIISIHFIGVYKSYKNKSFENLYRIVSFFYGLLNIFAIIDLISQLFMKFNTGNTQLSPLEIASIVIYTVMNISLIILYYTFIRELSFINFAFKNAKNMENIKNEIGKDPQMSQLFSAFFNFNNTNATENNKNSEKEVNTIDPRQEKIEKLMQMPNEQLYEVAKKLYISGYEKMDKEQLANIIVDIAENSQK